MNLDLLAHLRRIDSSTRAEGGFAVEEIDGFANHYVGRDESGLACVLLSSSDEGSRAPIRLSGLEVQYAVPCIVRIRGAAERQQVLTVARCPSRIDEAERYFMYVMATLVELIGPSPSIHQVATGITGLAAIFQRLAGPAKESLAGLAGELVLISVSRHPVQAVLAWRSDVDERYDFAQGTLRIDVKSSLSRRRVHGFSFEQCAVPQGCRGLVVSLFIEASAGGLSLEALLRLIRLRLAGHPHAMLRLDATIADTLGADLPNALGWAFDYALARSSMAQFDLGSIPAVRGTLEVGVSQVHFVSDLSSAQQISGDFIVLESAEAGTFFPIVG